MMTTLTLIPRSGRSEPNPLILSRRAVGRSGRSEPSPLILSRRAVRRSARSEPNPLILSRRAVRRSGRSGVSKDHRKLPKPEAEPHDSR